MFFPSKNSQKITFCQKCCVLVLKNLPDLYPVNSRVVVPQVETKLEAKVRGGLHQEVEEVERKVAMIQVFFGGKRAC